MIIIESQAVEPMFKNGFVIACPRTKVGAIIDPGDEVRGLLHFAEEQGISLQSILLTHAHFDHISGVAEAKRALAAPIYLHRDDLFLYDDAEAMGRMFGLNIPQPPPVDRFFTPHQKLTLGDLELSVHHTPGHCPGGVCLAVRSTAAGAGGIDLFVGDTLFAGSIGRTDLVGGDYDTLIASIRNVLLPFGDEARVHPGHGPSTTIGHERRTNPFLS